MTPATPQPLKSNGNGEVTKLLRWSGSIVVILAVFTSFVWYVIDAKIQPINEALTRYNAHFITIHEWQKEKGEKIAAIDAVKAQLEKRIDKLESRP